MEYMRAVDTAVMASSYTAVACRCNKQAHATCYILSPKLGILHAFNMIMRCTTKVTGLLQEVHCRSRLRWVAGSAARVLCCAFAGWSTFCSSTSVTHKLLVLDQELKGHRLPAAYHAELYDPAVHSWDNKAAQNAWPCDAYA